MIVRQATISDLDKTAEVFDKYRVFYGRETDIEGSRGFLFEMFKNLESVIFIAMEDDNSCAGFTQLFPSFSSVSMGKVYILNDLFVCQEYRNNGIGTALLDAAIGYCRTMGAVRITLTTEVDNITAQALYRKIGFEHDVENKVYHYYPKAD